jgi:hypothetical protein
LVSYATFTYLLFPSNEDLAFRERLLTMLTDLIGKNRLAICI